MNYLENELLHVLSTIARPLNSWEMKTLSWESNMVPPVKQRIFMDQLYVEFNQPFATVDDDPNSLPWGVERISDIYYAVPGHPDCFVQRRVHNPGMSEEQETLLFTKFGACKLEEFRARPNSFRT